MSSALSKKSPAEGYSSLYENPLNDLKPTTRRTRSDGVVDHHRRTLGHQLFGDPNDKENLIPTPTPTPNTKLSSLIPSINNKDVVPLRDRNITPTAASETKSKLLKSSSLQLCMLQQNPTTLRLNLWEPSQLENFNHPNVWDHSDSEAAPASSWSTLPNRYLLCRPLPLDIGRCTCVIVKETCLEQGLGGASLYSLYTNEGHGRQNRKLAVAHHRRRSGRSEFIVAQNPKGLLCNSDESILGTITANLMGSKYHIWEQGSTLDPLKIQSKLLVAVVGFVPTITTCTGSFRSLRAWIPEHQPVQLKNVSKIHHINGLNHDWEAKAKPLYSRVPHYNTFSRHYELDFRERGRAGLGVQRSVKNFQLTVEENGRHSILQLGKVGKSKYVMDYRYPLTGYQAFCICLASIDTKLCCTV